MENLEKMKVLMLALVTLLVIVVIGIILEQHTVEWELISPDQTHPAGYWVDAVTNL